MEKRLKIIKEKCPQDHRCPEVKVCPVRALSQEEFNAPTIDYDKCIACGKCANFCPKKALIYGSVERETVDNAELISIYFDKEGYKEETAINY